MKLEIWMIGKTRERYLQDGIEAYSKRLSRYLKVKSVVIREVKHASKLPPAELKRQEAALIFKKIEIKDFVVLLDERGRSMDSRKFAAYLEGRLQQSAQRTVFIIGGAYGFHESVYQRSNLQLSMSDMTFSHQLIRLIFWEQLYRAVSIMKGLPYHND